MKNIHCNPTPLRQKFIEYLTLNRKAERTVHCYVSFIHSLAKHFHRSPDLLSHDEIQHWLYHLIAERKQAPSTINLAINAVRSFYGKMLQQDIEPLQPLNKSTGQSIFYGAVAKAKLPDRGGIHCLRHSFATHCLENGIEITVVQMLLGHASLHTTAGYLHVRAERLAQIQSPLGLLDLRSAMIPA